MFKNNFFHNYFLKREENVESVEGLLDFASHFNSIFSKVLMLLKNVKILKQVFEK